MGIKMNSEEKSSGLRRIQTISNQLASKKESLVYNSTKNPLNKWRKKSNIDKKTVEDLYYPYHQDLRDDVYKIIKQNPEFVHTYQTEMTMDQQREICTRQIKVLLRELKKNTEDSKKSEKSLKNFTLSSNV